MRSALAPTASTNLFFTVSDELFCNDIFLESYFQFNDINSGVLFFLTSKTNATQVVSPRAVDLRKRGRRYKKN